MRLLVDSSVFIDHFRTADPNLVEKLEADEVLLHPWVLGELALGHLGRRRAAILADLALLPTAPVVAQDDVLALVEARGLAGCGLGWVDVQLLASARIPGVPLW